MEERRSYGKGEIRGNGFLLSTFDGVTSARAWEKKLEAFLLLHPVAEKEAMEMEALHMEDKTYIWWFKPLVHLRVSYFLVLAQSLIQTFDGERTKEEKLTPPWEEDCTNAATALEEQPSTSMDEEAIEGKSIAATQEGPKIHQGMSKVPLSILANNLKDGGISYEEVQGSNHLATLGPHVCTALCKGFKEEKNPHPHTSLMICIQPSRWECKILEDEVNHDTSMENHEENCTTGGRDSCYIIGGINSAIEHGWRGDITCLTFGSS